MKAQKKQYPAELFVEAQKSSEFQELKSKFRGFTFPMTVIFMVWYLVYVLMAVYAPGFMTTKVAGNINVAIVFGTLQFISTWLITWLYVRFANKNIEPRTESLRAEIEYATDHNVTLAEARKAITH